MELRVFDNDSVVSMRRDEEPAAVSQQREGRHSDLCQVGTVDAREATVDAVLFQTCEQRAPGFGRGWIVGRSRRQWNGESIEQPLYREGLVESRKRGVLSHAGIPSRLRARGKSPAAP